MFSPRNILQNFKQLEKTLREDAHYQFDTFKNWVLIIAGGAALLAGLIGIICPPLLAIDAVLVGSLIISGVTVGSVGAYAVTRGVLQNVSEATLMKLQEYVGQMHRHASSLSKATMDQNSKAQLLLYAFGDKEITFRHVDELCQSFEALRLSVRRALDDGVSPTAAAITVAFGGGVVADTV
jgi:hypothetical protein